jgi:hypothetical protein
MNTDQYHYRMNQLHRDDVIRAAKREHLIREIRIRRPLTQREIAARLMMVWHSLFRVS